MKNKAQKFASVLVIAALIAAACAKTENEIIDIEQAQFPFMGMNPMMGPMNPMMMGPMNPMMMGPPGPMMSHPNNFGDSPHSQYAVDYSKKCFVLLRS
jgi:hypothetical protein